MEPWRIQMAKIEAIYALYLTVDDPLIRRYFDLDSDKYLDEKIAVLTALKNGRTVERIKDYYKVLELLPPGDQLWD